MASRSGGRYMPSLIFRRDAAWAHGERTQKNNITAAKLMADVVRTSLGPYGMDKMMIDNVGVVTISADGATIIKEMEIEHPAARIIAEASRVQEKEVGDGTTSVVVLAGELLDKAEELINNGIHPTTIVQGYKMAAEKALEVVDRAGMRIRPSNKKMLKRLAATSIVGMFSPEERSHLADKTVEAILQVTRKVEGKFRVDPDDVIVEKQPGGSLMDTRLVQGIVLDKREVVHPDMPKRVRNAKIAVLNKGLEVKKTKFWGVAGSSRLQISMPEQLSAFQDAEKEIRKDLIKKVKASGANVLLTQKGIDEFSQYLLATEGIMAIRGVKDSDMEKLASATGGRVVSDLDDLRSEDLGRARVVEEVKFDEDRCLFIEGCANPRSVTIFVRGGSEKVIGGAERSLKKAIKVIKNVIEKPVIVAGGGATETDVAMKIRNWAGRLDRREQLAALKFAEALEVIPTALAENRGLDPIDVMTELRSRHNKGDRWAGVDVMGGKVASTRNTGIYEPITVKKHIINSATESACMILRIDSLLASAKMKEPEKTPRKGGPPGWRWPE